MDGKEIDGKIFVKKDFSWYAIDYFLDCIKPFGNAMSDKEFRKSYENMRKVVDDRMELPTKDFVEDYFIVVEQIKGKY